LVYSKLSVFLDCTSYTCGGRIWRRANGPAHATKVDTLKKTVEIWNWTDVVQVLIKLKNNAVASRMRPDAKQGFPEIEAKV
jgi:hypothetical protein